MHRKQTLLEGKHWPADYIKTATNMVKASQLGKQSWYTDAFIQQDMQTFANEFGPLSHKNSNLGFFSTIVKWFIEYSGTSKEKYQEFIERKLDGVIWTLQTILNDKQYDKVKDEIKQKWTFAQFEELQKKVNDEAKASSDEKMKNLVRRDDYDLVPIYIYEELNEKFGGPVTGYKGKSEWCHTNGQSTYNSWTKNGTQMFFVLAKKGWEKIVPSDPKTTTAYDEYGTSLIAILIDVATGNMLNETLRWNHIIEPNKTKPGATVDKAFKNNYGELSQAVGMDVKVEVQKAIKEKQDELKKVTQTANEEVAKVLKNAKIITDVTIPSKFKKQITKVNIPNGVENIGDRAFYNCKSLKSVTIPNSVTSIGYSAFSNCANLTSVTIPDSVTNIEWGVFSYCSRLTSVTIPNSVTSIQSSTFYGCDNLKDIIFKEKKIEDVKAMSNYPWGIDDELVIKTKETSLHENRATYLKKYADEEDINTVVDMFQAIRNRLSAPQNDIDWWIKKPFADLKRFVQTYDTSNKKQRRDIDYRRQAVENDAKLLGSRDGYEIWYVPTYEAMRVLGRFYKGQSAKWCVASDDPEFWYDNHDEDEFVLLIREHPEHDEFDKVAIQMQGHGRYFNEDDIVLWDLENNDDTFDNGVVDNAQDLIYYAWQLFKDNGELREQYYDAN